MVLFLERPTETQRANIYFEIARCDRCSFYLNNYHLLANPRRGKTPSRCNGRPALITPRDAADVCPVPAAIWTITIAAISCLMPRMSTGTPLQKQLPHFHRTTATGFTHNPVSHDPGTHAKAHAFSPCFGHLD